MTPGLTPGSSHEQDDDAPTSLFTDNPPPCPSSSSLFPLKPPETPLSTPAVVPTPSLSLTVTRRRQGSCASHDFLAGTGECCLRGGFGLDSKQEPSSQAQVAPGFGQTSRPRIGSPLYVRQITIFVSHQSGGPTGPDFWDDVRYYFADFTDKILAKKVMD